MRRDDRDYYVVKTLVDILGVSWDNVTQRKLFYAIRAKRSNKIRHLRDRREIDSFINRKLNPERFLDDGKR